MHDFEQRSWACGLPVCESTINFGALL